MTDYEKGSASWDIGLILTRHATECDRADNLRKTNVMQHRLDGPERLTRALATPCTCGAGDSDAERTSLRPKAHQQPTLSHGTVASQENNGAIAIAGDAGPPQAA